jgi:hypothetical protein
MYIIAEINFNRNNSELLTGRELMVSICDFEKNRLLKSFNTINESRKAFVENDKIIKLCSSKVLK